MDERLHPRTGTVALYVDLTREHARAAANAAAKTAVDQGFSIALCEDQGRVLELATPGARVEDAVLLITIGGDGTLLKAAQIAAPHEIPLFGINTGRLGFLTEVDGEDDIAAGVAAALRDGFVVDTRIALEAEVRGRSYIALNDMVVRRSNNAHMTPFGLFVDGREAAHVPADGIVVATPTGSTAYFLSAGGPILAPDVAAFGVVALLPHTLFSRPLIVADTSIITVRCDGTTQAATLEADGRIVDEIQAAEQVLIRRHRHRIRFARRTPLDFYELLEVKLRWNMPIKERAHGRDATR